uniref:Uncharacterized protein n=1 Tax=Zea mays TaxID=4577 RepID=A0A804LF93_MAIZE
MQAAAGSERKPAQAGHDADRSPAEGSVGALAAVRERLHGRPPPHSPAGGGEHQHHEPAVRDGRRAGRREGRPRRRQGVGRHRAARGGGYGDEGRPGVEREGTKDVLARILLLNETVLSSAVAAIRAEEERSVFFQEATLQFFDSDRNLEVARRQMEVMEGMEAELLAKSVEVEYLRAELKQAEMRF